MSEDNCRPHRTCTKLLKVNVSQRPKTTTGVYSLMPSLRKRNNGTSGVISQPEKEFEKKNKERLIEESRDNLRKDDEENTSSLSWTLKVSDRKRMQRIEGVDKFNNDVSIRALLNI